LEVWIYPPLLILISFLALPILEIEIPSLSLPLSFILLFYLLIIEVMAQESFYSIDQLVIKVEFTLILGLIFFYFYIFMD
jgi:hypothetical protein